VLLCGKPGSGKTFFVEQIMNELKLNPKHDLIKANLSSSNDISKTLSQHYISILGKDGQRVAFLDEVDTPVNDSHAYRHLLDPLVGTFTVDGTTGNMPGVLWFFAASKAQDENNFKEYLQSVDKGPDFFRRFEQDGSIITLPGLDHPIEAIVQLFANAAAMNSNLTHIDARVVYYFASKRWPDSGALKGAVRRTLGRIAPTLTEMPMASIADENDFTTFLAGNAVALEALKDTPIKIVK